MMCARRAGGRRLSGKPRSVHAGCACRSLRVSVLRLRSAHRLRRFPALDGSGQALRRSPGRCPPGLLTRCRRQSEELSRACERRLADGPGFAGQVRVLERVGELAARLSLRGRPLRSHDGLPVHAEAVDGVHRLVGGPRAGWSSAGSGASLPSAGSMLPWIPGPLHSVGAGFLGARHSAGTWRWAPWREWALGAVLA